MTRRLAFLLLLFTGAACAESPAVCPPADGVARLARAGLVRMLDLLGDTAAMVVSDLGEVRAQNATAKLLTGFNAPILHAMYLDKPMRDHTLLQAIARTNELKIL